MFPFSWTRFLEKLARHTLPKRPIVPFAACPDIQPVRNRFRAEDVRHTEVLTQANVVIPDRQHDFHTLIPLEEPAIVDVWNVVDRIIEVEITVVITVHERFHIE